MRPSSSSVVVVRRRPSSSSPQRQIFKVHRLRIQAYVFWKVALFGVEPSKNVPSKWPSRGYRPLLLAINATPHFVRSHTRQRARVLGPSATITQNGSPTPRGHQTLGLVGRGADELQKPVSTISFTFLSCLPRSRFFLNFGGHQHVGPREGQH